MGGCGQRPFAASRAIVPRTLANIPSQEVPAESDISGDCLTGQPEPQISPWQQKPLPTPGESFGFVCSDNPFQFPCG